MSEFKTQAYINGKWTKANGKTFKVTNPYDDEILADVTDCNRKDAEDAINAAVHAFPSWSQLTMIERSGYLIKIKNLLLERQKELATVLTQENGKPLAESMGEVGFTASFFQWFAEECRRYYGEVIPAPNVTKRMMTIRQPIGVAALITPWNFPIGMVGRKVSAALAAGCTVVLKPAEDTPLIALLFAKICDDIKLPPGVVNVVPCSHGNVQEIGLAFCESEDVRAISFTGSTSVGQWLIEKSAKTMKKMSLELGGDAPFIIFPSTNIEVALQTLVASKFRNTGQTCVTANRIFVHESIHDEFQNKFLQLMKTLKLGSGLEDGVNQGPIINQKQLNRVADMVDDAIGKGAKVLLGGKITNNNFFEPTLLANVDDTMRIMQEEIFGPVVAFTKFKTEKEVISLANKSKMGLAGYFCTTDISQAWRVAEALQVGIIGINEAAVSSCEMPFGGIKYSGFGKEGSKYGLDEYSDLKFVCYGNI